MIKCTFSLGNGEQKKIKVQEKDKKTHSYSNYFLWPKTHPWFTCTTHKTVLLAIPLCMQTHYVSTKLSCFAGLLQLLRTDGYALLWSFLCLDASQPITHILVSYKVHLCDWLTGCWSLQGWLRVKYQRNSSNHSWTEWLLLPPSHVLRDCQEVSDDLAR